MDLNKKEYAAFAKKHRKKSALFTDCLKAFSVGGTICLCGQILKTVFLKLGACEKDSGTLVSVTLIFLTAILTGAGVFDRIAKHAGAGTLVPITGFANAVVSPAIDNKAEGIVSGLGAKIFIIAGPVILYGTLSSVVYGVVLQLIRVFREVL